MKRGDSDVSLRIATETVGDGSVQTLANEIERLGEKGGKLAPQFKKLATEIRAMDASSGKAQGVLGRMRAGLASIGAEARKLPELLGRLSRVFGLGGAGLAGGLLAVAKNAADTADAMGKLAQRTGTTVESISRIAYAASLGDASVNDLEAGFRSLSTRMVDAAAGGAQSSAMFERLGISIKNADGSLRGVDEVFADLAERFKDMPEGAEKTAAAVDLLSRSGLALIPTLNNGAEGLRKLGEESDRFGKTVTKGAAAGAEQFNDNLTRLQAAISGVSQEIGNAAIPALNLLAEAFLAASAEQNNLVQGNAIDKWSQRGVRGVGFLVDMLDGVDRTVEVVGKGLGAYGAMAVQGAKGNAAAVKQIYAQLGRDVDEILLRKLFSSRLDEAAAEQVRETSEAVAKELDEAYQARIAAEKAFGVRIDAVRTEELKRLRETLAAQLKAYDEANAALEAAQKRRESIEKSNDEFIAGIGAKRKPKDEVNEYSILNVGTLLSRGRAANETGDLEGAIKVAEEAKALITKIDDAGLSNTLYLTSLAKQAAQIQDTAARGLEGQEKARIEEIQKLIAETVGQTEMLKQITIGFDQEGAEKSADELRAILQERLGANPIQIPVETIGIGEQLREAGGRGGDLPTISATTSAGSQPGRAVNVQADTQKASTALDEVKTAVDKIPEQKTVIIKTIVDGVPTFRDNTNINFGLPRRAYGGPLPGRALHDRSDNVIYRGTPGEWVVQRPAVRFYGRNFMDALNNMRLPKFAHGGELPGAAATAGMDFPPSLLDRVAIPRLSPDAANVRERVASDLVMPDGTRFPVETTPDVHREIERVLARAAISAGSRSRRNTR